MTTRLIEMMKRCVPDRGTGITSALSLGAAAMLGASVVTLAPVPASAQLSVFDPSNYSQNLLTAARTLQQINNQIQSLQNDATMILNQAKNLTRINFPELAALRATMTQIDRLMGTAQGISYRVSNLDTEFKAMFPQDLNAALRGNQQVMAARDRIDTAMAAYRQTMAVQSQVVESVTADAANLNALVAKSQGADGALAAQQATNQLLALGAKQQFQIQQMMAAQYRSQTIEAARRAQAELDARASTKKFLGSGTAYTPLPPR